MTLHFTNTLTRAKEPFAPIDEKNVRMYVCGPTVYDFAHIGNARPAVVFDVLFRLLRHVYGQNHVTYVRNITDVDDKINARAKRDFPDLPLNEAIAQVTQKTTKQYHADLAALGCLEPTHEPRATAHIPGMIAMIESLIAKGNAYVAEGQEGGEVLFDTVSMPNYGALSKRNLDEQQAGARIAVEAHKKHPGDFVLWKLSSADEPGWESPWGRGRPGWHIECSVMSDALLWDAVKETLGEEGLSKPHQFDIHGGGLDLIFPHHENEIAQSCCANGTDVMANTWLHNGFVQVEGRKMSKSEGNFVTIHDVVETKRVGGVKWHGLVVRLALLMSNYREPLDFSEDRLIEAREKLYDLNVACHQAPPAPPTEEIISALSDDLNFAKSRVLLNQIRNSIAHRNQHFTPIESASSLRAALELLGLYYDGQSTDLLGYEVIDAGPHDDIEISINQRAKALKDRNFPEADRIRDELAEKGIQLKDGKDPETGERTTSWEVKR